MTRTHWCHACRGRIELERKAGRRDDCPHCGAELHVCLNCSFYDPSLTRGCRENQADEVREKDRANFCGWFEFREGRPGEEADDAARQAAAAFFARGLDDRPNPMAGLLDRHEPRKEDPIARFFEPEKKKDDEARRSEAEAGFDALFKKR